MSHTNLVIDISNLVWRARYSKLKNGRSGKPQPFSRELLFQETFKELNRIYRKYSAKGMLIACDSPHVWRRDEYPEYKRHRDEMRDIYYRDVKEVIKDMATFFNTVTAVPAIAITKAEADDVIAAAAMVCTNPMVIVSSDKDFVQLLGDGRVRLYSPQQDEERKTNNPEYDLFEKCIRGDSGDNIHSAFPRVRGERLVKAFTDKGEMLQLMEHKLKSGERVGDLYKRNQRLIDLKMIPSDIQRDIMDALAEVSLNDHKYNAVEAMKFLSDYNLREVAKDLSKYSAMLKGNYVL